METQSKIQCLVVKPSKESKKKGWTFLDSMQLMPVSLDKAAKALGVEVTKDANFNYDIPEDDPRWNEYLERDCVSLYQSLMAFYELIENMGGEVGITTASTAMKTFQMRYQNRPIERHTAHADFFREAYYGGRVEIYREKADNLSYYDINSAYPFAMLQPMPVGNLNAYWANLSRGTGMR